MGLELISWTNQEGIEKGINPFDHGSKNYTDIMKTQASSRRSTPAATTPHSVALVATRRSLEQGTGLQLPRQVSPLGSQESAPRALEPLQRPGQQGREHPCLPLSNWTELDVWQYIHLENIDIVPLYFSAPRPVVTRDGVTIMVDDDRFQFEPGEEAEEKWVRFRTLGCYPLSGGVESTATTLPEIIQEMLLATRSEREGRVIDYDQSGSMEEKKREGYF